MGVGGGGGGGEYIVQRSMCGNRHLGGVVWKLSCFLNGVLNT